MSRTERVAQAGAMAVLGLVAVGALTALVYAAIHIPITRARFVILYEVFPAIVLLAAGAGLCARGETRLMAAACAAAAGVACYVIEVVLIIGAGGYAPPLRDPAPPGFAGPWDARSPLAVILDLRAHGVAAYPAPNRPEHAAIDRRRGLARPLYPLSGIANVLTVFCNESGVYANYVSDPYGFNNPPSAWRAGAADVVLVGDSFAHGACVDTSATIASDIRRTYPATVTLGINGSGPLHELATLREYAMPLRPRVLLWLYYAGNDFSDFEDERADGFLMRYRERSFRQGLMARQPEIDSVLRAYVDGEMARAIAATHRVWVTNAKGFLTVRHLREKAFPLLTSHSAVPMALPCSGDRFDQFVNLIADASAEVAAQGGRFYFVYLPEWAPPERSGRWFGQCSPSHDALLRALHGRGVRDIDLEARFGADTAARRRWQPNPSSHYGPAGYADAAQVVLDRLATDPERAR